ncbi:MAG TPA: S8 family serine peptidase [Candidatus Cloacimonas sp.]|nr:S8 family serine peptidase [Candidatus Cloacimonas sp.]
MKSFTVFLALLLAFGLFAADFSENAGTAIFKLKPEYRSALQKSHNRTGIASIDEKLQKLQVSSINSKFLISPQKREECELSLIFEVHSSYPPQAVVNLLSSDPFVQYAEVIYPDKAFVFPDDEYYEDSYYFTSLEAEAAWDIHQGENGTSPVIIAIVDTGCRWTHPDLAENIWQNLGEDANHNGYTIYNNGSTWVMDSGDENGIDDDENGKIDDLIGWDFMLTSSGGESNNPYESSGHGTTVSGIASARTNNTIGVSSLAWNLTLMPVSCSYQGSSSIYNGYQGIIYAAENGADIINCSWGGTTYSQAYQDVINYAYSLGSVIVAAAGNNNNTIPVYPAAYKNVLAVAALQNDGIKSSVSSYGSYVDVGAPTGSIGTVTASGYTTVSNATSYASPIASSLAGLIKSYITNISQNDLLNRIKGSCDDVDAANSGKENLLGEGKLNAQRALQEDNPLPDEEIRLALIENRGATDANGNLAVEPGETFSVNLLLQSYGDYAANGTFTLSTTNPYVNILSSSHNQNIPADDYITLEEVFSIYVLPTATSQYVTFNLQTTADLTVVAGNNLSFSILINAGGIFVWEGVSGGRDMSGTFIKSTLQNLGYTCTYGTTFPSSFYSFEAVFLSFGAVGSNIVRFDKTYMFNALYNYLLSGGRVYIEGVDVVGFDLTYYLPNIQGELDAYEVLWPLLGISSAEDGVTNAINNLSGCAYTPSAGMLFTSSAQTKVDYIDRFTGFYPYAVSAFEESDYGCVAVACAGGYNQRSFVFSYALSELADGTFPNTKANLVARIMDFFTAEEVTLPVELTAFYATYANGATVFWNTASETNLLGYNLYRNSCSDISNAVKLNSVIIPATGLVTGNNYRYYDSETALSDTLYYWLESISYDGFNQVFGSAVLIMPFPESETPLIPAEELEYLNAYPNPFGNFVSLELKVYSPAPVTMQIYNIKGQLLRKVEYPYLETGIHHLVWDGLDNQQRNTTSGIYLMVVKTRERAFMRKLLKL